MSEPAPAWPAFDRSVPDGGYAWWYLDARSDDGEEALTLIAFVGSVFSPYYAWRRRRGRPWPREHCALNLALYRRRRSRWAMTERGSSALSATADALVIGPSALVWGDGVLTIDVDERATPWMTPMRGRIVVRPRTLFARRHALDHRSRHWWQPVAPLADIEVAFLSPAVSWRGEAYLDMNHGCEPLEHGFSGWEWMRTHVGTGTEIAYSTRPREGGPRMLAHTYSSDGRIEDLPAPPEHPLPRTRWGLAQRTHCDATRVRVAARLEDTPFYARSALTLERPDGLAQAIHETVDLDRFSRPWVQAMLPFRMPRLARAAR